MNPSELIRSIGAALAFGLIAWLSSCVPANAANCTIGVGAECPPLVKHINSAGLPQDGNAVPGDTILMQAPTTASASINFPSGPTPSSPNNGDCWNDNGAGSLAAGWWCHIGGINVGPLGATASGGGGTTLLCTITDAGVTVSEFDFNTSTCPSFPGSYKDFFVIMNFDIGNSSTNESVDLQLSNNNGSSYDTTSGSYFTQTFDQNATSTGFAVSSDPGINLIVGSSGTFKGYIYNLPTGVGGAQGGLYFDFSASACVNCNSFPSTNSRISRGFYAGAQTANNAFRLVKASGNNFLPSSDSVSLYGINQ